VNIAGFQSDRPHASRGFTTVYRARRAGEPTPRYAIKSFQPPAEVADGRDPAAIRDFLAAAGVQERLAKAGKRHWAPVYASGAEGAGAFYVTRLFPGSAQQLVQARARINSRVLHALLSGTVKGLRELGRPHGNLKPSNVLVGGRRRPRQSKVFLTDPLPDDQAGADHAQDLRALGDLLHQLVCHREAPEHATPMDEPKAWAGLGADAPRWRALCRRLLDPSAGGKPFSLEQAEAELKAIGRRLAVRRVLAVGGAAAAAAAAMVAYLVLTQKPPPDFQWEHLRSEYAWYRQVNKDKALLPSLGEPGTAEIDTLMETVLEHRTQYWADYDKPLHEILPYRREPLEASIDKGDVNRARLQLQTLRQSLFSSERERLRGVARDWARQADDLDPASWSRRAAYLDDLGKRLDTFTAFSVPRYASAEKFDIGRFPNAEEGARTLREMNESWRGASAIGGKWPDVAALREEIKGSAAKDKLRWVDEYLKKILPGDQRGPGDLQELAAKLEQWTAVPDGWVVALRQRLKDTHWDCVKPGPTLAEDGVKGWLDQIKRQNSRTPWSEALAGSLETIVREKNVAAKYLELFPELRGAVDLAYKVGTLSRSGCCPACLDIESVIYGHEKAREDVRQSVVKWAATRRKEADEHLQKRLAAYENPLPEVRAEITRLSDGLLKRRTDIEKVEPKGSLTDADLAIATAFKQTAELFLGEKVLGDWRERVRIHVAYLRNELKEEGENAPPEEVAPLAEAIGKYETLAGPPGAVAEKAIDDGIKNLVTRLVLKVRETKALLASDLTALGALPPPLKDSMPVRNHITTRDKDADNLLGLLGQPSKKRPPDLRKTIEQIRQEAEALGKDVETVKGEAGLVAKGMEPFISSRNLGLLADQLRSHVTAAPQGALAGLTAYKEQAPRLRELLTVLAETFPRNPNLRPTPKAMPIPPEAVEAERLAAVEKTVKQSFPDLKSPQDTVRQKLQADAAAWQKWLDDVRLLADRAGAVEASLEDGYVLNETPPPETKTLDEVFKDAEQAAGRLDGASLAKPPAMVNVLAPLRRRVDALGQIKRETDASKVAKAAEDAVAAQEVAAARTAWKQAGELDWPKDESELAKDRGIRRQLLSHVKVKGNAAREAELQKGARERWEKCFGRLTEAADIVKAIEDINADRNKDVREFDLSNKLDDAQALQSSDVFKLAAPREQYNVLRWWLEQALNDKPADADKAKVDEVRKRFVDIVRTRLAPLCTPGSAVEAFITWLWQQKSGDDEGPTDWSKVGPGEFGWRPPDPRTEPRRNDQVRYTWQVPINNGSTYELTFRRLANQQCLLCTTEAPFGLVRDWLQHGRHKDRAFAAMNQDGSFTSAAPRGPCVYVPDFKVLKTSARFSVATEWLKVPIDADVKQEDLYAGSNEFPPARDKEDTTPKDKHPMNQVSAKAALQLARLLNCRLPTMAEYKAAYDEDKDWKDANLRGRTWWDQVKYLNEHYKIPADSTSPLLPGYGSFAARILYKDSAGKGPDAEPPPAEASSGGVLWFERVDEGKHIFQHLVGNVMEFTCENKDRQDKMPPDSALPPELKASFGVAGGSALSPRSGPNNFQYDRPYPLDAAYTTLRFSDVGFRLALTAPKLSLRDRILAALQTPPNKGFLPPK
jgi:hypothetical protein